MIITYLRSSSYAAWDWCNHRYYLEYTLGIKYPANRKADKGNITHKALELLARQKQAGQEGRLQFTEPETGQDFSVLSLTPDKAIQFGWWFYTQHRPTTHAWTDRDFKDCRTWMWQTLDYNDGQYSPLKRHVLSPEQYFDIEIREPWARYSYDLPDGTKAEGYLGIKGTVDLVTQANASTIEYIDWKTGETRMDWATGQEKTPEKLRNDPQLRMYHYALARLYPKTPFVVMTIFYIRAGGPFSFCFGRNDLKKTEDMLRRRFEAIKNTTRPKLTKTWKCSRLCQYGTNEQPGTGKTVCEHMKDELVTLGMDRVDKKYMKPDAFRSYGEGGGKTKREG